MYNYLNVDFILYEHKNDQRSEPPVMYVHRLSSTFRKPENYEGHWITFERYSTCDPFPGPLINSLRSMRNSTASKQAPQSFLGESKSHDIV